MSVRIMKLAAVFTLILGLGAWAEQKPNELLLEGVWLKAPENFVWYKLELPAAEAKRARMYVAKSPDTAAKLYVTEFKKTLEGSNERTADARQFYENVKRALARDGAKNFQSDVRQIKEPVKERADFFVKTLIKDEAWIVAARVVYARKTFHIQAASSTIEESRKLVSATDGLK